MTDTVTPRYSGSRVPRVEDLRLLTGRGTFVDDVQRPGMLHACFVRSPFARARINGVDASAALALPGVHSVFTAADLNSDIGEAWHAVVGRDVPDTPRPPLAEGEAKFVGDPVALVVADNRYIAEDAIELVEVDYEPLPALADFTKAVGLRWWSMRPTRTTSRAEWAVPRRTRDLRLGRARRLGECLPADLCAGADRNAGTGGRVGGRVR